LGLSEEVAACFVRVARKSQQVPELKRAIDSGHLTITKAKTIASVIKPENQETWIEKAKSLSKGKLEQEVATAAPNMSKPERAKPVANDRVRVELELSIEEMEWFRRCQDLVSQKGRTFASLSQTQVALMEYFLNKNDPVRKADRGARSR